MKCIHCKSEWNVSPGLSVSITNCPFCGKALLPEKKKLDTAEDVLVEINNRFGISILTDETKLIAYFSDLAPQLSKQRRILGYFVECGGPKKLVSVMASSEAEQIICVKQIIRDMKEEMFIEETASRMICDSFLFAISGHRSTEAAIPDQSKETRITNHSADVKKITAAEPTADELFKKGEDYYRGTATVPKDYPRAFECYQKAATQGHAMAQCQLGFMYREGQGTAKDEQKAFDWFMKAAQANQNCPRSKFHVGYCYHCGIGVKMDHKEAVRWYTMGAKEGESYSQNNLGCCYRRGEGVPVNYETAVYWYELSAKQCNPLAQYNLGLMYKVGYGVTQDKAKAFSLFKQSADQGDPDGILQLGLCYLDGDGVKKDKAQAFFYLKQAAEMGGNFAQYKLGYGYEQGIWGAKNPQEAVAWYQKAADGGNADAQLWLGQAYETGSILAKNKNLAMQWYQKAAAQGNQTAAALLQKPCSLDLSRGRVASLVQKYQLANRFLVSGTTDFSKKFLKAANEYAPEAPGENPVLMEDKTIFGSAKEGFILTQKKLYHNGGFLVGKSSYFIDKIESVSTNLYNLFYISLKIASDNPNAASTSLDVTYTTNREEAIRIQNFWKELLGFPQS